MADRDWPEKDLLRAYWKSTVLSVLSFLWLKTKRKSLNTVKHSNEVYLANLVTQSALMDLSAGDR
jgi:hypothetical protein